MISQKLKNFFKALKLGKISSLQEENEKLNQILLEATRVEEMRKNFVANASHELRSPAAGLQALQDAFELGGLESPEQRKKFLALMKGEVNRLNAIIRDLLDLSDLEREKEFSKEYLCLPKVFNEWLKSYEFQAQEKKITFATRFEDPEIVLEVSHSDIEKLFRNLLENAIKYTPAGGKVEVGLKKTNGQVQGWIQDSGMGISKDHIPRIFERFYRVDKSRSRELGGTGLGLAIAKHAVERHHGKIWVESEESAGSTFHFTLPLTG